MSPIEIDPATGAPIVTPPKSDNPFLAETDKQKLEEATTVNTPPTPSIPTDAIKPMTEAKPLVGIDNSIEEAKRFNSKLNTPTPIQPLSTSVEQKVDKDVELRSILKRYGMDSQQQEKAFAEIKSLLG